jgi:phosphatidate phosphatase APP1
MSKFKKQALSILYNSKFTFFKAKLWLGKKLGIVRSVMIMPYLGFGNAKELFFLGRVLKDRGIGISNPEDSKWKNFKKMYKRFATWEIPGVRIKASFHGISQITTTDEEGYFEFKMNLQTPVHVTNSWQEIKLELIDKVLRNQKPTIAVNRVFIPPENVKFGVISDIDDTIVPTGTARLWEMLKTTFLGNAYSRIPFPGVSAFYQALSKGSAKNENNPFFYVSSSPWNLYDFLMEFMEIHHLPQGPLMLRDIGLSREHFISGSHTEHKLLQVERIFEIIKNIPFILIGDSGQHDTEIYLRVIRDYPGRVKMVYIRDVDKHKKQKILEIAGEIKNLGVELLLVSDTVEASLHATSKGWIAAEDIVKVAVEKKEDEDKKLL